MHEHRLDRVAHARSLHLRVHDDVPRPFEWSGLVEQDVHHSRTRLDHRDGGLRHDGLDELGASSGHEDVDDAAGVHEFTRAFATEVVDGLNRLRVDSAGRERAAHRAHQRRVGRLRRRSAAQHHRVPGAQRERGDVDSDVRACFVDGTDDAERNAHLGQPHAVGQCALIEDPADRVGQLGDVAHGCGQRADSVLVEAEPVLQCCGQSVGAAALEILRVRSDDIGGCVVDRVRNRQKRAALGRIVEQADGARGRLGEQHPLACGCRCRGHPPSVSTGCGAVARRSGPVSGIETGSGCGSNQVPMSSPRRARSTRSALVTRTPTPDAAATRAAETFVAAPPVPTLLTTTEPNSYPRRSSPYSMWWIGRAPGSLGVAYRGSRCR